MRVVAISLLPFCFFFALDVLDGRPTLEEKGSTDASISAKGPGKAKDGYKAALCKGNEEWLKDFKPLRLHVVSKIAGKGAPRRGQRVISRPANQRAKFAKVGQVVTLHAVLEAKLGKKKVYFTSAEQIRLKCSARLFCPHFGLEIG